MIKKKSVHDKIIDWLVERLTSNKRYSNIETKVSYTSKKSDKELNGEVDVLTYNKKNDVYHFYEVKSTYTTGRYNKAVKQYLRYCKAYPNRKVKGIFISPKRICRLDKIFSQHF